MVISWYYKRIKILLAKIIRIVIILVKSRGYLSKYPNFVKKFESDFGNYIGSRYAVSFCNGTSAIEAALFACGVKDGDEVLVSSCSIHSTAGAIISVGAKPIFVDIEAASLNFDPNEIDNKITKNTKALIVVHLWGNPANMKEINKKANTYNLKVIEDCSHAHGASINGKKVGTFGDIGCFSLQGYKAVSALEGGISVTDNEDYFHRLNLFGHFGRNKNSILKTSYAELIETGIETKRRANPLGILLAAVDLKYLDSINEIKRKYTIKLQKKLKPLEFVRFIEPLPGAIKGGFFPGIPIIIDNATSKKEYINRINKKLKSSLLISYPIEYKPPDPHYHQLRHFIDIQYRHNLIYNINNEERISPFIPQSLSNTEKLLDHVLLSPNCYKLKKFRFKRSSK